MTKLTDKTKKSYLPVYISGDELPSIDDLASQATRVLEYATGYYFVTAEAADHVKEYVAEHNDDLMNQIETKLKQLQ